MIHSSVQAAPHFNVSEVTGAGQDSELMICDLDGDGLKDLVLMEGTNLSIFYQDNEHGFTRDPQQTYALAHCPCVIWPAKLGGPAESLLIMTSDGVSELCFTNRTGPPVLREIIRQPTIIPDSAESRKVTYVPFSAATGGNWPLLLVPTADGLQVWQHRDEWRQVQVIGQVHDAYLWPSVVNPGYTRSLALDLSVGDVNGDGRDDLMIRRSNIGSTTNTYRLYLQQTNGQFGPEPALTYADEVKLFAWLDWVDLNHNGKVDLIKGIWLNEASFIPGVPGDKVVVGIYSADPHGGLPARPQQVFRKNDWTSAVPVVDLDGDGYPDLVLGYSHLGSKDDLLREITARQLDYSLKFYYYRPGTGFPNEPDGQRDVVIHLDHAESPLDWRLALNFEGYVKFDHGFNGQGESDLLVRDQSDYISVYFFVSREQGFSLEPDLRFSCPEPFDDWQVADLNCDGVSDLIVKLAKQNTYRIFISQK